MKPLILAGICTLALTTMASARPVSYPGGWTAMTMNDGDASSLHVHYSPTAKYSFGYRGEYNRANDWQFHGLQGNYLVNRWNKPESQANLYLKGAVGMAHSDEALFDSETEPAGFVGMAADWETRRYFTSYETRLFEAGDIHRAFEQKARVGIAPYIGEYGDLHTWLMLEVDHRPEREEPVTVAPLVRLFKGPGLLEAGWRSDNTALFNFVYRF